MNLKGQKKRVTRLTSSSSHLLDPLAAPVDPLSKAVLQDQLPERQLTQAVVPVKMRKEEDSHVADSWKQLRREAVEQQQGTRGGHEDLSADLENRHAQIIQVEELIEIDK